jgi:hypothetical protein
VAVDPPIGSIVYLGANDVASGSLFSLNYTTPERYYLQAQDYIDSSSHYPDGVGVEPGSSGGIYVRHLSFPQMWNGDKLPVSCDVTRSRDNDAECRLTCTTDGSPMYTCYDDPIYWQTQNSDVNCQIADLYAVGQ